MLPRLSLMIAARREARGISQAELAGVIGVDVTTVARYEKGEVRPKNVKVIRRLAETLDFSQKELDGLYEEWLSRRRQAGNFVIRGYDYLYEKGIDEYDFVDRLLEIDARVMPDLPMADLGTTLQWAPVFHASPDTWRVMVREGTIIGYWQYLWLTDEAYESVVRGEMRDSEISVSHIDFPLVGYESSCRNLYLIMLGVDPQFHNPHTCGLLVQSFVEHFRASAALGVLPDRAAAKAQTQQGLDLCIKFGFAPVLHSTLYPGNLPQLLTIDGSIEVWTRNLTHPAPPRTARSR